MTTLAGRGKQLLSAFVTEEVVAREDVVDLEAVGAREALADVALQQALVAHDLAASLVGVLARRRRSEARLATARRFHAPSVAPGSWPEPSSDARRPSHWEDLLRKVYFSSASNEDGVKGVVSRK